MPLRESWNAAWSRPHEGRGYAFTQHERVRIDINTPHPRFPETTMIEPTAARPDLAKEPRSVTEEVLRRVRGEFLEMPGLRVTETQARRLWGLDAAMCSALLGVLIDARFLFRTRDGAFMRIEYAAPVKASLSSRTKGITSA